MGQAASVPRSIDDIFLQAREGDAAAFADLVRAHEAMVFSLARHFVGNRESAEDLAQEVFLELHRNLACVESAAHLTFWLRRVTSHRSIDRLRRQAVRPEVAAEHVAEPGASSVMPDVFLESRLRQLVDALPSHARLVVVLRYQEDLDPSEIADTLGMSINTVKSHLRRALDRLRCGLSESGGGL